MILYLSLMKRKKLRYFILGMAPSKIFILDHNLEVNVEFIFN